MTFEKVPQCLRDLPHWVLWKTIVRDGQETKLPFQAAGGAAKSNDRTTWATFDEALAAFNLGNHSGIGFMFSEGDEFCGIDLDGCRHPETGAYAQWALDILQRMNSYSEVSPSKTGAKIFVRGKSPWASGRKFNVFGAERICDKTPAIEVYDRLRYFAVTGHRIGKLSQDVEPRQAELQWLAATYEPKPEPQPATDWQSESAIVERARKYLATLPVSISGQGGHNAAFRAACASVIDFGLSESDAMGLLREWNQGCQPPWSERELSHKVSDATKQPGERNRLRNAKPENWSKIRIEHRAAPVTQAPPNKITLEVAARKHLEQVATGKSTLIELGLPDVDYAIGGGVEPGEMIILAARPSHGKSAVALQAIHHVTSNGIPAAMVSEEMSASALGKRVVQFASNVPQEHWKFDTVQVAAELDKHFKLRAPCIVIESCQTAERAADAIRRTVEEDGVRFVVVDYAQLLGSKGNSRYEQVTQTSVALRRVASETGAVLLVLCQLSRSIESRPKFVPVMGDIKDTGQLEQDADVILFLCWPHRLDSKNHPDEYLFFVAKNRNRAINQPVVKCVFKPSRQMLVSEQPGRDRTGAKGRDFNADEWADVQYDAYQEE